jgi:hypothetical protein
VPCGQFVRRVGQLLIHLSAHPQQQLAQGSAVIQEFIRPGQNILRHLHQDGHAVSLGGADQIAQLQGRGDAISQEFSLGTTPLHAMLQGGSHQFDGDGLDQACVGLKAGGVPSIRQMSLFYPFIQRHGGQPRDIGTSQYPAVQGMVRQRYDPPVVGVQRSLLRVLNGQC